MALLRRTGGAIMLVYQIQQESLDAPVTVINAVFYFINKAINLPTRLWVRPLRLPDRLRRKLYIIWRYQDLDK